MAATLTELPCLYSDRAIQNSATSSASSATTAVAVIPALAPVCDCADQVARRHHLFRALVCAYVPDKLDTPGPVLQAHAASPRSHHFLHLLILPSPTRASP